MGAKVKREEDALLPGRCAIMARDIVLRAATPADWPLLRAWVARPDMRRWLGSPSAAEAEIRIVFETPSAIARVIEFEGVPVGYCHAMDATFWGAELPDGLDAGTWDIDMVIAEPSARGLGLGRGALDLLADEVFQSTLALALCVFVPVSNEPMVRAYERAGFRWVRLWDDPEFGTTWMMRRERRVAGAFATRAPAV